MTWLIPVRSLLAGGRCALVLLWVGWLCAGEALLLRADRSANWHIYRASDGLAESYCASVSINPKGHVWVKHGEANEVSLLDGYSIQTLPSPGRDNYRVYESRTGQFWSLYSGGLLVYAGHLWVRCPVAEIEEEIRADPRRQIRQIPLLPAEQNHILILLSDRLMEFDLSSKKAVVLKVATETGLGKFIEMTETRRGNLWISGTRGLCKLAGPVRHLTAESIWQEFLVDESLHVESIQKPSEDDRGEITALGVDARASSKRILVHFDGSAWTARPVDAVNLRQAWTGWDHSTWGFALNSLLRFDSPPSSAFAKEKIWAGQYNDVAVDTNGVFWLATSEGLLRYAPYLWRTPGPVDDINSHVHAMVEDPSGRIWFASSDYLISFDQGRWRTNKWPEGLLEGSFEPRDRLYSLPNGSVAITAGDRSLLYDPAQQQFQNLLPTNQHVRIVGQLPTQALIIQLLDEDLNRAEGWRLATFNGSTFQPYLDSPPDWSFGNELFFVTVLPNGDVWLGAHNGLARYQSGRFDSFGPVQGFRAARALSIVEAGNGRVWCSSLDKIYEFNGKTWSIVRSGFDRIARMIRGREDKVWVASAQGLFSYSSANATWVVHGVEEGLPSAGVSEVLTDREGRLWAGTTRGLSLYHPDADISPPRTLKPLLENAKEATTGENAVMLLNGIDQWQETPAARLLYATRLDEGLWSPFTNSTAVTFTRLGAGRHHLDVRAMDRNWNEDHELATLDFSVLLAWYKDPRLLVIGLSGAALVLFFAGLAINRHLQLTRSYEEVERIVTLRTRELERANEELLQSQKMRALGTLAAGIAHDFNNILSIIKGSAQIIQSNLEDKQKILTRLSRIQSVVEQGSGIVKSILGLSRVKEKGLTRTDLNGVVEDTMKLLGDRFLSDVTVHFKPTPSLPSALVVKELMQQMLLNLILNAADAMERRGQVILLTGELQYLPRNLALSPERSARYLFVAVQDTGCGIAPDILPRIFEPFFTTKALSSRRGTGLGLSIVYEMARELGYGLEVISTVGKGTTFSILVPAPADSPLESKAEMKPS